MSTKISWFITFLAVFGMLIMYFLMNKDIAQGDYIFRPVSPIVQKTNLADGRELVPISETVPLKPNQMGAIPF